LWNEWLMSITGRNKGQIPCPASLRRACESIVDPTALAFTPRWVRMCRRRRSYEAGGHRGVFNPREQDDRLGTIALTRLLVSNLDVPVIAAGGIMDGAGVAAALALGAAAAQLGTAFIACPESSADAGYRAALLGPPAQHTVMTATISGRPARCLANRSTALGAEIEPEDVPDYPIAYDAAKALHVAAKAAGEFGYGAQWAGQGAPLARAAPAAELVAQLRTEMERALSNRTRPCS